MKNIFLTLILVTLVAVGSAVSKAQAVLVRDVIGSGGGIGHVTTSSTTRLSGTIGQHVAGQVDVPLGGGGAANVPTRNYQGFWLPIDQTLTDVDEDGPLVDAGGDVYNFPNPFSSSTTVVVKAHLVGEVTVTIYDLVGNTVKTLSMQAESMNDIELPWDGRDLAGAPVAAGNYLYEVRGTSALSGQMFLRMGRMLVMH